MSTKDNRFISERCTLRDTINYSDRFLRIMKSRGLVRKTLCEYARVKSSEIGDLLHFNRLPKRTSLVRLCKVLQITPEFFTLPEHSLLELVYKSGKHYCFNYYTDFEIMFGYDPNDFDRVYKIFL